MEDLTAEIRRLYEGWWRALPAHDLAYLDRILDEDWVYTDSAARRRSKADYLELVPKLVSSDHTSTLTDVQASFVSDRVVLATGHYHVRGLMQHGADVDLSMNFTGVWVEKQGELCCVAHHTTEISEPKW